MKFILLFFTLWTYAQGGFKIINNKNKTVIPFTLINNLIFVPVNINGAKLTLLLDSGVNETILFSLGNNDVEFRDVQKMKFIGLGENIEVEGLLSVYNKATVGKEFTDSNHTVYIILNEDFNFSSHIGIPVNGILGYHFFKDHQVKIDYLTKIITVYSEKAQVQKNLKKFESLPLTIENNKPYLVAEVEQTTKKMPAKMLIDLGNSDALWLFPSLIPNFMYNRPNIDDYLGRGFNGDIYGKRSRIHNLYLGKNTLVKPLAAMPDEYSIQHLKLVKDRKGSIGGETLRRFTLVFDYPGNKLYFKKNRNFSDSFHLNMSGLDIRHNGMTWESDIVKVENPRSFSQTTNEQSAYSSKGEFQYKFVLKPVYFVAGCRENSPAYEAGLRKEDKIISINGKKAGDYTLQSINELLKSEEGREIQIEAERVGRTMKFKFYLEDPIPYHQN